MVSPGPVNRLLVLVGPTASGKSALGLRAAAHFGGEIVNADSRQFYCELHIGTAKPSTDERAAIPHHLIDCASIVTPWDAGDFVSHAHQAIRDIQSRGRLPIVVGGTGMYVRHLLYGLANVPEIPDAIRAELKNRLAREGLAALYAELQRRDPEEAARLKPSDTQRILRSLEVLQHTGRSLRDFWPDTHKPLFNHVKIGLNPERAELYRRSDARVLDMLARGLKSEVEELGKTYPDNALLAKTIGYAEWLKWGFANESKVAYEIQKNTRHFAKRQLTWFRREHDIHWIAESEAEKQWQAVLAIFK